MTKFFSPLLVLFLLSACATAPENLARNIHFAWDIKPETEASQTLALEQGEIFFEWHATAPATHSMKQAGRDIPLVLAKTIYGNIYCTGGMKSDKCYEDRDGDGLFDTVWKANPTTQTPIVSLAVSAPEELKTPIRYTASQSKEVVAEQKLGILYDGALRGTVDADGDYTFMVGSFGLGWHDGKTAPRDPTGKGWSAVNFMMLVYSDRKMAKIAVEKLGVTYAIAKAAVDGHITVEFSAKKKSGVYLNEELDVDLPKTQEDEDGVDKVI